MASMNRLTAVRTKFVSRMAQARRQVLCIEDDRETAALIAGEVERDFDVSVAYGGQEGLLAVMKTTPDFDFVRHQHARHGRL